jgi:hypothetical protein
MEIVMPVHLKSANAEGRTEHECDGEFSKDLLRGAEEIAQFLYGDRAQRRKVYHLVATSNIPVFKLGSTICARKSILVQWIRSQEDRRARLPGRSQADDRQR